MAIVVTPTYLSFRQNQTGEYIRRAKLTVTGLTAGAANTIPHGLPTPPQIVNYVATSGTPGFETSPADGTNLYFTTGTSQTSLVAYADY